MPIPAIIAAAGTIIGSQIASQGARNVNAANIKLAREQMAHNEKLMDKQNAFSLDMWNRTNEYNDPLHQVERLKEAGLNPLYYGLDGSSADSFESAAANPYSLPSLSNPYASWQNLSSQFADIAVKQAQIDNLRADTAKKNNENITETQRRENMKIQQQKDVQEIENMKSLKSNTEAQTRSIEKGLEWMDRLNQAEVDYKESASKFSDAQTKRIEELIQGEKLLQAKGIEDFEYKWKVLMAQAEKDSALAGLSRLDIENYTLNHMQSGVFGSGLSIPNIIRRGKEFLKPKKDKPQEPLNLYGGESIDEMFSHE